MSSQGQSKLNLIASLKILPHAALALICSAHVCTGQAECNPKRVCWFARAAIVKYHRLDDLDNRNEFSHSPGARGPRSRCRQSWFLLRPRSWACGWLLLTVTSDGLSSVHAHPGVFVSFINPPVVLD